MTQGHDIHVKLDNFVHKYPTTKHIQNTRPSDRNMLINKKSRISSQLHLNGYILRHDD